MIQLQIHYKVDFGQALYISGKWNFEKAIRINWTWEDIWISDVAYHNMEYKHFISKYDKVQNIYLESGYYRVTNKHSFDVWNHRKICFQCSNSKNLQIYIEIIFNLEQYYKAALLIFQDGLTNPKKMVYLLTKNIFYGYVPNKYNDCLVLKKANLKTIIEFCNMKEQSTLEQKTINQEIVHLIVDLYYFKQESFTQSLLQLIQFLIQKYQVIYINIYYFQLLYISNKSLTHLRKYLSAYEKLTFSPES
ncbi:unnamed protein product [Paramecium primaurelia]|uniref:Uncharacterized protein n=1 Tax=Paramecium primaurelia TaxID=5886 RepID=A0A8S1LJB2_PARPR|nr:unnamed protein product [Paramecium primaurelia]